MNRENMPNCMVEKLGAHEEVVHQQALSFINKYWVSWKTQNKIVVAKGDLTALGRFAPIIRKTTAGHIDIDWRDFGVNHFRKKNKSYSKRIKPYRDGYKLTQFTREAKPWELELIEAYLEKINLVRAELKAIHQCRIIYQRFYRKYYPVTQQPTPQLEEVDHD